MYSALGAVFLSLISTVALADQTDIDDAPMPVLSDSSFENPEDELKVKTQANVPSCADSDLLEKVQDEIKTFQNKQPTNSSLEKRRKALIRANIKGFESVDATNFVPETDYNVANALIMLKINDKIKAEDITLCRQTGQGNLYLIMYPFQDKIKTHIINLDVMDNTNQGLSFIYP